MENAESCLWTVSSFEQELLRTLTVDAEQFRTLQVPLSDLKTHGTTIGALRVEKGSKVVAFSDGKGTVMDMAFLKSMDKVLQVDDHSCLLISGSASYGILLARALRSYFAIRQNTDQRVLPASAKTSFLRRSLMNMLPMAGQGMGVMPLFVTFDHGHSREGRLYLFTMDGMFAPVDCKVLGSGFHSGNAPLEDRYAEYMADKGDVTLNEGIALARRILAKTTTDDNGSGGTWTIKVIDADGVHSVGESAFSVSGERE